MSKAVEVLMIGPLGKTGGVAIHTKYLTSELVKLGAKVITYDSDYESELPKSLGNVIKVYKRTIGMTVHSVKNRSKFKIIHIQSSGGLAGFLNALTAVTMLPFLGEKRLVITFHYNDTPSFIKKYRYLLKVVLSRADQFILVSSQQRKAFLDARLESNRLSVIPNGFDPGLFKPLKPNCARKKLSTPLNQSILLNIANLEEYKGQKYLISCMNSIITSRKDIELYIIGRGSLEKELQEMIDKNGLREHAHLLGGNKTSEEISTWMNACDIFILPSIKESFGIVQIEAMACGKPVIATRNGGSEDIITDEKLGILVAPKDSDSLAKAVLEALNLDWDREYIIKYVQRFTWREVAKKTSRIYNNLLD